jgi:hypothetical protein
MMLFDPEVGPSIKGEKVAGRQGGEERLMSATVEQRTTGAGESDQGWVTLPQRLKQPMK